MFKDHFSQNSENYAKYRPGYPSGLFHFIANQCSTHRYAWDVGCGSGQASIELANYFENVMATDASADQIWAAQPCENVNYIVAPAESCPEQNQVFDLVTIAQAIHWFDVGKFWQEVIRVTKPGGLLAFWTYNLHRVDEQIDEVVDHFYNHVVGEFWPPERDLVDSQYSSIDVPFDELDCPTFPYQQQWTITDVVNYISTWSAVKNYKNRNGQDPIPQFFEDLSRVWSENEKKTVTWTIFVRAFRI